DSADVVSAPTLLLASPEVGVPPWLVAAISSSSSAVVPPVEVPVDVPPSNVTVLAADALSPPPGSSGAAHAAAHHPLHTTSHVRGPPPRRSFRHARTITTACRDAQAPPRAQRPRLARPSRCAGPPGAATLRPRCSIVCAAGSHRPPNDPSSR